MVVAIDDQFDSKITYPLDYINASNYYRWTVCESVSWYLGLLTFYCLRQQVLLTQGKFQLLSSFVCFTISAN